MQLELAVVLSCDETGCLVQLLGTEAPVQTQYAAAVKDRIRIRRKQLVAVDHSVDPPQIVWRWFRAEVLEQRGQRLVVGAFCHCVEAEVAQPDLQPTVGEEVWLAGHGDGAQVLDRVVDEEPEHPVWLREYTFPQIETAYAAMAG